MLSLFKILLALLIAATYVDYEGMSFPLFVRLLESLGEYQDLLVALLIGWLLMPLLGHHR